MSAKTIEEAVAERLAKIGPEVADEVISILVEKELKLRTDQVSATFSEFDNLTKRLKKIDRGDIQTFNADGSVATTLYSKSRLDEVKKIKERLEKIENALNDAITNSNFEKLQKLGSPMKIDNNRGNPNNSEEESSE